MYRRQRGDSAPDAVDLLMEAQAIEHREARHLLAAERLLVEEHRVLRELTGMVSGTDSNAA